ncbi:MAG: hypothetical protein KF773_39080 [Deltaproteobacteria bacterium]|nr:hypothetical protein [Deltaproteobacteria bacterium]MCW5801884.1 hypothetical protein [Deltaproteobacteria bacterium]
MRLAPVAVAAVLGMAGVASANGRAPLTNGIAFRPGDAHSIYVRSTFGLLVSHDDGCSFRWVCEQAVGYGGEFDPKYAIAADGTIFATTFKGLRVSRDGGCTWSTATDEIWVDAIDIGPTGEVWFATAETARASDVYRSRDNGVTFERRGMLSPNIWWKSVKVARTNPSRVYVTGYQVAGPPLDDGGLQHPQAHFFRSDDSGDTWTEEPLAGVQYNATPIVLVRALDPDNPDVVLMSSLGANGAGDRLYRSSDAGATFAEVLVTDEGIRDVVFHGGKVIVATLTKGTFESGDNGKTFAPIANAPQLGCLGTHEGALVGCAANWQPDFMAVTRAPETSGWQRVFRFVELAGPLSCPAGTTAADKCDPQWPALRDQFAATGPSTCNGPIATDAPVAEEPPKDRGGCCDANTDPRAGLVLGGLVAALVMSRRRRSGSAA